MICGLCSEAPECKGCRADENSASADDSCARAAVCYQRKCCLDKGIQGCWKCADFPCDNDMFSPERDVRLKAFIRCAKLDGVKGLAGNILRNQGKGILYHRDSEKHTGDYDCFCGEDAVLQMLRHNISDLENR